MGKTNLRWKQLTDEDKAVFLLRGVIDDADLEPLQASIAGPTVFDLRGIKRINSHGVRHWIRFISSIEQFGPHTLQRCSVAIVDQLNTVANFRGSARVASVMAPFYCPQCGLEALLEVDPQLQFDSDDAPVCPPCDDPDCPKRMDLDDVISRYESLK